MDNGVQIVGAGLGWVEEGKGRKIGTIIGSARIKTQVNK